MNYFKLHNHLIALLMQFNVQRLMIRVSRDMVLDILVHCRKR